MAPPVVCSSLFSLAASVTPLSSFITDSWVARSKKVECVFVRVEGGRLAFRLPTSQK